MSWRLREHPEALQSRGITTFFYRHRTYGFALAPMLVQSLGGGGTFRVAEWQLFLLKRDERGTRCSEIACVVGPDELRALREFIDRELEAAESLPETIG